MDVSENSGVPKSSILIGFSIVNHPFWGTTIFGNTHIGTSQNNRSQKYTSFPLKLAIVWGDLGVYDF